MTTASSPLIARRRRPRGWGRALSARKVRKLVAFDQSWECLDGTVWQVVGIHRADGQVRLERADFRGFRFVGFGKLGKGYRLGDGQ
jgi:hypothetical protein